eukprot:36739-Eustigmatos_ZCMA.PRE.1
MRAVRAGYSRTIVTTGVLAALFGAPLLAQSGSAEATSMQDKSRGVHKRQVYEDAVHVHSIDCAVAY